MEKKNEQCVGLELGERTWRARRVDKMSQITRPDKCFHAPINAPFFEEHPTVKLQHFVFSTPTALLKFLHTLQNNIPNNGMVWWEWILGIWGFLYLSVKKLFRLLIQIIQIIWLFFWCWKWLHYWGRIYSILWVTVSQIDIRQMY